jgi:hypothetical protein
MGDGQIVQIDSIIPNGPPSVKSRRPVSGAANELVGNQGSVLRQHAVVRSGARVMNLRAAETTRI